MKNNNTTLRTKALEKTTSQRKENKTKKDPNSL
jgi:hypothetical protein